MIQQIGSRFRSVKTLLAVVVLTLSMVMPDGSPVQAQSAPAAPPVAVAEPQFEVATIKPVKDPSPGHWQDRFNGRQYITHIAARSHHDGLWAEPASDRGWAGVGCGG